MYILDITYNNKCYNSKIFVYIFLYIFSTNQNPVEPFIMRLQRGAHETA